MSLLGRDGILAAATLRTDVVAIEGGSVRVRELLAGERTGFLERLKGDPGGVPAYLVRCACINDDGTPIFSEADVDVLANASPSVLDKIASGVLRLSAMGGDELGEAAASAASSGSNTD